MLELEVLNRAGQGKRFPFKSGITIGTDASCTLRAVHPDLKPVHARLVLIDGRPGVECIDPAATVSVNQVALTRAQVRHNDVLSLGPLRLRVIDASRMSQISSLDAMLDAFEQSGDGQVYDFAKEDLFYLVTKDPSLKQSIAFTIPSKDRFIEQAQSFLSRLVKTSAMDEEKVDAFMTCAKELILNAHRHGHQYDEAKTITLRWRDLGDKVQLHIADQGKGFDHKRVVEAANAQDAATAARERYLAGGFGGLGFQLIVRLADELRYNDAGNEVTMTISKRAGA